MHDHLAEPALAFQPDRHGRHSLDYRGKQEGNGVFFSSSDAQPPSDLHLPASIFEVT